MKEQDKQVQQAQNLTDDNKVKLRDEQLGDISGGGMCVKLDDVCAFKVGEEVKVKGTNITVIIKELGDGAYETISKYTGMRRRYKENELSKI